MPLFVARFSRIQKTTIMLLPDNIHPENSVFYNAAFVLKTLQQSEAIELLDLYLRTKQSKEMSMPVFVLCLDWLFLINLVSLNEKGRVELCF